MSSIENLKDVAPPVMVRDAIAKNYPGWKISEDSYHMTSHNNGKKKERYGFVMVKDGKKKHVYTDAKGKFLK